MQIIPLSQVPSQRIQVVLDNQDCDISILTRGSHMYMNLTVNGTVVQNGAILEDCVSAVQIPNDIFSGTLAFVDMQGTGAPQYMGLGERWLFVYWSEGEYMAPVNRTPERD